MDKRTRYSQIANRIFTIGALVSLAVAYFTPDRDYFGKVHAAYAITIFTLAALAAYAIEKYGKPSD